MVRVHSGLPFLSLNPLSRQFDGSLDRLKTRMLVSVPHVTQRETSL
jgi:hypothetical protein